MSCDVHKSIRTGGVLAVCIAAVLLLLTGQWFLLRRDVDSQIVTGNTIPMAKAAATFTKTLNDQRRLLNVESERRAALVQESRAGVNCSPGLTLGKGGDAIACGKQLGVIPASVAAIGSMAAAFQHTDAKLNGENGVLTQISATLELVAAEIITLGSKSEATIDESTKAMHALEVLLSDKNLPQTLANIEKGTGAFAAAGTSVEQILEDLRHPQKPGKFIRAVSIMLQILHGTSLAGQSAPVFGK